VVVFDRIRENLALRWGKLGKTINLSINEVLFRTIVTNGTVFLVVVALYFFGGVVLEGFALAMTLGALVDTYSSVFVAGPIVYSWRKEANRAEVKRKEVVQLAARLQKQEEKKTQSKKKKKDEKSRGKDGWGVIRSHGPGNRPKIG
jgi:Protein export membrane protein